MERRFEVRKLELIAECQVHAAAFSGMIERLASFAQPFIDWLTRREQMDHAKAYLAGLLSSVERKNVESIAYWRIAAGARDPSIMDSPVEVGLTGEAGA